MVWQRPHHHKQPLQDQYCRRHLRLLHLHHLRLARKFLPVWTAQARRPNRRALATVTEFEGGDCPKLHMTGVFSLQQQLNDREIRRLLGQVQLPQDNSVDFEL